jgi:hypothetical protein
MITILIINKILKFYYRKPIRDVMIVNKFDTLGYGEYAKETEIGWM